MLFSLIIMAVDIVDKQTWYWRYAISDKVPQQFVTKTFAFPQANAEGGNDCDPVAKYGSKNQLNQQHKSYYKKALQQYYRCGNRRDNWKTHSFAKSHIMPMRYSVPF